MSLYLPGDHDGRVISHDVLFSLDGPVMWASDTSGLIST